MTNPRTSPIAGARKRAAIYCRVSSSGQEDNSSLGTQEAGCRAYAEAHGLEVTAVYRDVHTGAEVFERPQLTELRTAMRAGAFEVLIVHALDRLSRKQTHQGLILSEAEHAGVEWQSVTEDIDNSPQGQILRAVIGGMAEMERLKISERTVRGRIARARSGKLLPGARPPYGYRWRTEEKSALDIDPVTAPIVRDVFEDIAGGGSLQGVVRRLIDSGVPTASGTGRWRVQSVREMLFKHLYFGRAYAWGWSKRTSDCPQQFDLTKAIMLPEGTVPAIVTEDIWKAAQARLSINRQRALRNAKDPEGALLRGGYIVCGVCGYTVMTRPRSDGGFDYVCRTSRANGCTGCSIKSHILDEAVWGKVSALLSNPEFVLTEIQRMRGDDPTERDLASVDLAFLDIDRQQVNLARTIALVDDPAASAPLAVQLKYLQDRRVNLQAEQKRVMARQSAWKQEQIALDSLKTMQHRLAQNLSTMTWSEKRTALDALGVHILLNPYKRLADTPRFVISASIPIGAMSGAT